MAEICILEGYMENSKEWYVPIIYLNKNWNPFLWHWVLLCGTFCEPKTLHKLGKPSTTALYPQPS